MFNIIFQCTSSWLEEALKVLPKHNSGGSVTATDSQLEDFHRSLIRQAIVNYYYILVLICTNKII